MIFTENETTTKIGYCQATCLKVTINRLGDNIYTWELMYPRYIHSELMTHRMFSRNASSSRATPLPVTLNEVRTNPVFFNRVGKNQSGMVAEKDLDIKDICDFKKDWDSLAIEVANRVEAMSKKYCIHKQHLNRALEPFLPIRTIVTATEVSNFFDLRLAGDAQPEIQDLAVCMSQSLAKAEPEEAPFHIPYAENFKEQDIQDLLIRSIAACARVCVGKQNGKETDFASDLALVRSLHDGRHMSPFEHCAVAVDGKFYANFFGWQSVRNMMESRINVFSHYFDCIEL